jgi:hypothetical protein
MTRGDGPRAADAWDPVSAAGCGREQKGEKPGGGGRGQAGLGGTVPGGADSNRI